MLSTSFNHPFVSDARASDRARILSSVRLRPRVSVWHFACSLVSVLDHTVLAIITVLALLDFSVVVSDGARQAVRFILRLVRFIIGQPS